MTIEALTTADVVQGGGEDVRIIPNLRPIFSGPVLSGTAATCVCAPADNLALHQALAAAPAGAVLVCDAGGRLDGGYLGELMAMDALNQGVRGLLINGSVRDTAQLEQLGFPVFCLGRAIPSCGKSEAISFGEPVTLEGVRVEPDDIVVADADGVVVVAAERWPSVEERARDVQRREAEIAARIGAGTRIFDVLSLVD